MTGDVEGALRLVYMGTAGFAVPALRALAASRHEVAAVYSQPARPAGRGMKARTSAVGRAALELGLGLRTPARLRDEAEQAAFRALRADLAVVAAYGLILPKPILDAPRLGCVNLHGSRLPRWRGAAPIQRSILAGDHETGVTIIQMEEGLDTGPMLAMTPVPIGPTTTAAGLHDELAALAAEMIVPLVDRLAAGPLQATPQPEEGACYASKIDKAEGRIDWRQPASAIDRQIRALNPWPGVWTEIDGQRLLVLEASPLDGGRTRDAGQPGEVLDDRLTVACGTGALRIARLQRAGGKPLDADTFLRGFPLPAGRHLGAPCLATS